MIGPARRSIGFWPVIGAICLAGGAYSAVLRFSQGLGAATNLSDSFPWGLWIGFDVLCGVGLAAGGFTVSAVVYLFNLEKYRPIARPAVLTAFIGYLLVIGGLIFDLGHPWRIWHPLIMWNHHSVMFEVAWCVTLYTTVLAAEVSAMVFEKLQWPRLARAAHVATLPLTLAAVLLSMLHQSSLGSLFLIVPGRLHALWYSPLLPLEFLVSAIAAGLAMTIIESNLSARALGRCVEAKVLDGVARMAAVTLGIYLVIRAADFVGGDAFDKLTPLTPAVGLFALEIVLGVLLPLVLFAQRRVRKNTRALYHTAQLAVLGLIVHRLNVSITGFEAVSGQTYVPAWTEVAVTASLVTLGFTAFYLAAKHLPVFETDCDAPVRRALWRRSVRNLARELPDGLPRAHGARVGT